MAKVKIQGTCLCGCNIRICLAVWSCLSIFGNIIYIIETIVTLTQLGTVTATLSQTTNKNLNVLNITANATNTNGTVIPEEVFGFMYAQLMLSVIMSCLNIITMTFLFHSVNTDNASHCRLWMKVEIIRIIMTFCGVVLYSIFMMIKFGATPLEISITILFLPLGMLIPIYVVTLVRRFISEVEAAKIHGAAGRFVYQH